TPSSQGPRRNSMSEKLTVLIPCKDERKNIRLCIESIRDIADEILVADSGSTDGTLDIVRGIGGCRVIEREYVNHGDFLNWAIPHATHEWVMIVDADERITKPLMHEIQEIKRDGPGDVDAYWVSFKCFFMGHPLTYSRWNTDALRLVRRDVCRNRTCRVHPEYVVPKSRTRKLRHPIDHYSYWTYDEYFRKYQNYTKLVAQDRWDAGSRAGWFGLLVRPALRFLQLYLLKLGFLDGLPGLQICMLTAFYNTFVKQARLWEMQYAIPQPDPEQDGSLHHDAEAEASRRQAAA
ncbi:MAG: glycosyltransferase family 2 protein, partial [Planctomycetes bacterium]|nr:glycosyltransferase family 2 protein [Planctomycetota bacterium]